MAVSRAGWRSIPPEEYEALQQASETLSYIHSSLIGASLASTSQPAYRHLASALMLLMPDGSDMRTRMDCMQDYMREHQDEFR